MWRPDRSLRGPDRPSLRDIDPLNRVFADAFTDRYSRDGLVGVRVPHLNTLVWRYAIEDAGDGAMIWRDAEGQMVAFNMVHQSGVEGWMGPLAVRPDRQGEGLGSTMVRLGIDWLKSQGARTIGLETMPRTVENIGFYSRIGLVPGPLTVTLVHDVPRRISAAPELLSAAGHQLDQRLEECRRLTDDLVSGVDFTREIALTRDLGIGDTTLVRDGGELLGFALWHSAPLAAGRAKDEVRVLKLVARNLGAFDRLLDALHGTAAGERVGRIGLRCQTDFADAYLRLIEAGYRVHWTDLRMILRGFSQRPPRQGIMLSNWEI
ncbi:MAG TPA: GNAT family N-acetyltransferase [Gemmatimonadales bacterium]|nr:GNAT family N-acetyltransferase [Gemmatimonadales bacterium]